MEMLRCKKKKGNKFFKELQFSRAITLYQEIIEELDSKVKFNSIEIKETKELKSVCYSNLSAAFYHQRKFVESEEFASKAIETRNDWIRGYERKIKALIQLNRTEEANEVIEKLLHFHLKKDYLENSPKIEEEGLLKLMNASKYYLSSVFHEKLKNDQRINLKFPSSIIIIDSNGFGNFTSLSGMLNKSSIILVNKKYTIKDHLYLYNKEIQVIGYNCFDYSIKPVLQNIKNKTNNLFVLHSSSIFFENLFFLYQIDITSQLFPKPINSIVGVEESSLNFQNCKAQTSFPWINVINSSTRIENSEISNSSCVVLAGNQSSVIVNNLKIHNISRIGFEGRSGAQMKLKNCNFSKIDGCIQLSFNKYNLLELENCLFFKTNKRNQNKVLGNHYSSIFVSGGNLRINNCKFQECSSLKGESLLNSVGNSNVSVINSSFIGESNFMQHKQHGSGLWFESTKRITLKNNTFKNISNGVSISNIKKKNYEKILENNNFIDTIFDCLCIGEGFEQFFPVCKNQMKLKMYPSKVFSNEVIKKQSIKKRNKREKKMKKKGRKYIKKNGQLLAEEKKISFVRCFCCSIGEKKNQKFKKCSRCKRAYYCSRKCQKEHWPIHKIECKLNQI